MNTQINYFRTYRIVWQSFAKKGPREGEKIDGRKKLKNNTTKIEQSSLSLSRSRATVIISRTRKPSLEVAPTTLASFVGREFSVGCNLFAVSMHVFFSSTVSACAVTGFHFQVHFQIKRNTFSSRDLEFWHVTLILDVVKMNYCAKCLGEKSFRLKLIIHRHTRTQPPDCSTQPLQQSCACRLFSQSINSRLAPQRVRQLTSRPR